MLLAISITSFVLAVGILLMWVSKKHGNLLFKKLKTKEYRAKVENDDGSPYDTLICDKGGKAIDNVPKDDKLWLANQSTKDSYILIGEDDIDFLHNDEEICNSSSLNPQTMLPVILESSDEEDDTDNFQECNLKHFSI